MAIDQYPLHSPIQFTYLVKVAGVLTHASGGVVLNIERDGTNVVTPVPMTESTTGTYACTFEAPVSALYNATAISINPDSSASMQFFVYPDAAE